MSARGPVRWGILGPGAIARDVAKGIAGIDNAILAAVASRDGRRAQAFIETFGDVNTRCYDSYPALAADPNIDAIYVATPHPFHVEHSLLALEAGKSVLCEKPAGLYAADVLATTAAARLHGCFFMEAYMYLLHPQIARLRKLIEQGSIGRVFHVEASFGFAAEFDSSSRLFAKELAGGGLLDVGGYPVSAARCIAGWLDGQPFADPISVVGNGSFGKTGVDERAFALLTFANGMTAQCSCAVRMEMANTINVVGELGRLVLHDPWTPGRDTQSIVSTSLDLSIGDSTVSEKIEAEHYLYTYEVEHASSAILAGLLEGPEPAMSWANSLGNAKTLDSWREALQTNAAVIG